MTSKEAISYIENYGWSTTRLGLDRTRALLSALGNPEKKLKFIHVAGSNGKGSTCSMLASVLKEAGYKTGLYISPYIQEFGERIQINGEYIAGERLAEITERVKELADKMEDHPSQFELVTAIALQYYAEEKCDIVVLEVGMGGAMDSTNVIDAPEVAVITNIGLEHTEYLGDTLEEIAETKGGIIKPGCSVVLYDGASEVTKTIARICSDKEVPLKVANFSEIEKLYSDLDGQSFIWKRISEKRLDENTYTISLLGEHQLHNALVVLNTLQTLIDKGWKIEEAAIKDGLKNCRWPARFEVLSREPVFILDGGHNPQCAEALVTGIKEYLPGEKIIFLLGVLSDKDYESIIDMMMPYSDSFVTVTPLSDRALSAEELAEKIKEKGGNGEAASNIFDGVLKCIKKGLEENLPVIAFGSLYLAGEVRNEFMRAYKKALKNKQVKARESLSEEERIEKSNRIAKTVMNLEEFKEAEKIFIYKWIGGEVKLDLLETEAPEKNYLYPLCLDEGEMLAISPGRGEDAWKEGAFGIKEPVKEKGQVIPPEEIDLVICPLTGFDEKCNRLGMGGGYYDRFLPKAINASKIGVAYEVQKLSSVPMDVHDVSPDIIVTEEQKYKK